MLNMSKAYSNNLKIIIIIPYLKLFFFFSLKLSSFGTKNRSFLRIYEKVFLPVSQMFVGQLST